MMEQERRPVLRSTRDRISYNAVARLAGRSAGGILSLIALRLSAHYFEPVGWGPIVTALAFVGLFSTVADFGVSSLLSRDLARPGEQVGPLFGGGLLGAFGASVVLTAAAAAVGALAFHGRANVVLLVVLMLPTIPLSALFAAASAVLVARSRNDIRAIFDIVSSLIPLAGVVALIAEHAGGVAYAIVQSATDLAMAAIGLGVVLPMSRPGIRLGLGRAPRLVREALALGFYQAIGVAYDRLDTLLVAGFLSVTRVAWFGLASQVTAFFSAVPGIATAAAIPAFMRKDDAGRRALVERIAEVLTVVAVLVCLIGVLFSKEVLMVIGGRRYLEASTSAALLFGATALSFLTSVFVTVGYLLDLPRVFLRTSLLVLGSSVAFNLVAIPLWGIDGAGAAALVSQLVGIAYSGWAVRSATDLMPRLGRVSRLVAVGLAAAGLWLLVDHLFGFASTGRLVFLEAALVGVAYLGGALVVWARRLDRRHTEG
ncbi:MAG: oligosaccharide flippase family protein [Actinomycetota bacterium]|nr:oligosaccharide flippase family protein [Actinomycetota bacterium]